MADDLALMDAPTLDSAPAEPIDTGVDTPVVEETPETPEGDEPEPAEGEDGAPKPGETPAIDGAKLSEAAKAHISELKKTNPALANQLRSALYEVGAIKQEFPGGVKEIRQFKQEIQAYGGVDGIKGLKEQNDNWTNIDQEFMNADPRFVNTMVEANAPAFSDLAPHVFEKYREVNADGWTGYVAGVFASDLASNQVELALARLGDFVDGNPKAQQLIEHLNKYVGRVKELAGKKPADLKKPEQIQPDSRQAELDARENTLRQNEWSSAAGNDRLSIYNKAWADVTKGRNISEQDQAAIKELAHARITKALNSKTDFKQNIDKYFKANDKAGYLRYLSSFYKAEIPNHLRSAAATILKTKPGPKPGPGTTPGGISAPKPGSPDAGFKWAAARPDPTTMDRIKTTAQMIQEGKAILKDGSKIQWSK